MKRSRPPQRNLERLRAWQQRSRRPLPQASERRKRECSKRERVRAVVIERDGSCRAAGLAPGRCLSPDPRRPQLEVHELYPGATRALTYLQAKLCVAVCQRHHDWITAHHHEAQTLGLVRPEPLHTHDIETKITRRKGTR